MGISILGFMRCWITEASILGLARKVRRWLCLTTSACRTHCADTALHCIGSHRPGAPCTSSLHSLHCNRQTSMADKEGPSMLACLCLTASASHMFLSNWPSLHQRSLFTARALHCIGAHYTISLHCTGAHFFWCSLH